MKLKYTTASFLIIFSIFSVSAFAGENKASSLTFFQALEAAREKNPAVIMADERVRQALEELGQARSYLFPRADAGVSETRQTRNLETFGIPLSATAPALTPPFNAFDARIKLTQRIFDVSSVRRLEAAGVNKDLSSAELRKAREDAMALVGSLYIEAGRARDSLEVSRTLLHLCLEKYRLADVRLSQGAGSQMELKEAKTALSQARYEWKESATKAHSALLDLKTALGYSENEPLALTEEPARLLQGLPKKTVAIEDDLKDHPAVQAAGLKARLAKAEEGAAWTELLPKVSVSADTGPNGPSAGDTENTYSFGIQGSMPIFDAGERWAKAEEDASRAREAEAAAADTRRKTTVEAMEARSILKNARKLVAAKQDLLAEADWRSALAKTRFSNGTASRLDLLAAAAGSAQALDQRSEAVAFYRTAQIHMAYALGELDKFSQVRE